MTKIFFPCKRISTSEKHPKDFGHMVFGFWSMTFVTKWAILFWLELHTNLSDCTKSGDF